MFSEYSLPPIRKQTLIQTTENTVEKELFVLIGDKQAPVTQKQNATDHIDETLGDFQDFEAFPIVFFFLLILLEF